MKNVLLSKPKLIIACFFFIKLVLLAFAYQIIVLEGVDYSEQIPAQWFGLYKAFGHDELFYHHQALLFAESIKQNGFYFNFKPYMSDTLHFGHSFFFALLIVVFDIDVFGFLVAKLAIFHFLGCWYFYKFVRLLAGSNRIALVSLLFVLLYPPLNIHSVSLLREEFIFTFLATSLYFCLKSSKSLAWRPTFCFFLSLLTLLTLRGHAAAAAFGFWITSLCVEHRSARSFFSSLLAVVALLFLVSLYLDLSVYNQYIKVIFSKIMVEAEWSKFILEIPRIVFSPLPWKITSNNHHEYLRYWYLFSLAAIIISVIRLDLILTSLRKYKWHVGVFCTFYFIVYLTLQDYGPRQFSVVGPFLFVFFYSEIVNKIVFDFRGRREVGLSTSTVP